MALNAALPNPRFERKFIAVGCTLQEVLAMVRTSPGGFREPFPPRIVHNVYLDTPAFADYYDHVHGTADRQKTRVRWYGIMNGEPLKPVLERKLKRGLVSGKMAETLTATTHERVLSREGLQGLLAESKLSETLAFSLPFLKPSLYNRYARRYFASMSGHVRLTVDCGLSFAAPGEADTGGLDTQGWHFDPIIELKFEPHRATETVAVSNHFPFRLVRCSKYVLGMERVMGL